jgi:succinate dehydrogenase/fumarate reductase flavoprotein subunit
MTQLSVPPPELLSESHIVTWDEAADVVVVGFGGAGASAAIEARRHGVDVLVVERASGGGGATGIAGGHVYLGGGTPVQTACGFEDTPDEMYKYLAALTPDPHPKKLRLYCDESVAHFHWLEECGVPFERSYYPGKAAMQPGSECLIWSGNEKAWPFRDIARPAPRGHKVAFAGGDAGQVLMKHLIATAHSIGVRELCDARVTHLIADGDGTIMGVRVRRFDEVLNIRARAGVVLAAGGYIMNDTIFENELSWLPRDLIKHGTPYDDGSGILLGVSAGGQPMRLDRAFLTSPFYPPENMIKGILVNRDGKRFVAEDSYHGRTAGFTVEQPDGIAYLILDSETFGYPPYEYFEQRLIDGWDTVEEMEAGIGLPKGSLVQTMARYNADMATGQDSEFHKYKDWLKPLTAPPYAAFDLSLNRAKYAGFSLGGLKTNENAEVLGEGDLPVPGLYAAGACAWNIAQDARGYSSGTCIGEATFFGRRAGRVAAARAADEV